MPQDPISDTCVLKTARLFERHRSAHVAALKDNRVADPLVPAQALMHDAYGAVREVTGNGGLIAALESRLQQLRAEGGAEGP